MYEDLGITPKAPHSDVHTMSAFSSTLYRIFRGCRFSPSDITDLTKFEMIIRRAAEVGKSAKQLKELSAAEQAAFETCVPILMTCYAQEITNDILHEEIPAVIAGSGLVSGTDYTYTIDDKDQIGKEFDTIDVVSIPGLEDLVAEIVGTSMVIESPDDLRKFPGIKMYYYLPSKTITNMRAYLATLAANAHLFKSYCDKMGVKTTRWSSSKIRSKRGPTMIPFNWNDKFYQFWAYNGWMWYMNVTADQYLFQSRHDQAMALYSAVSWLTYYQYVYKQGENPNSYNNIIRMFYPYHNGNNLIGATELNTAQTICAIDDAIADLDTNCLSVAINGTELDWVTNANIVDLIAKHPGLLSDNQTLGTDITIDTAPTAKALVDEALLPPDFKQHDFGPVAGFWDATNFNAEIMFFQKVMVGGGRMKGTEGVSKKRTYNKQEDEGE